MDSLWPKLFEPALICCHPEAAAEGSGAVGGSSYHCAQVFPVWVHHSISDITRRPMPRILRLRAQNDILIPRMNAPGDALRFLVAGSESLRSVAHTTLNG